MASPNFPSTGLVADVTTFQVGDITYLWDGEKWKSITGPLSHGLLSNRAAADSHPISAISGVADRLALSGNAVFASTADLLTGTSRDGVISDATFQALVGTTTQCKTDGFYAGSTSGSANYTFLNEADSTAAGYVTGYSRFQVKGLNVYACLYISNGKVFVEQNGVIPGVDSSLAHNYTANLCRVTGATLSSKFGETYTVSSSVNFRSIQNIDYKSQMNGDGEFVTLILGGDSNDTTQFYKQSVFKVNRGGSLPAVRIVGSNKNDIRIGEASIVELYADTQLSLGGTDEYCAYNRIFVQSCTTFQINSNPSTDGSIIQWINENQIYLQFCLYLKVFDNGYQHNGNQFWGGNFEAADSTIEFETGVANTMRNVRGESALAITFGENAANNTILTDWFGSPNNPAAGSTVIDNGLNNCVKNINDITNDRVTIMSCNGTSLKDDGSGNSNLIGMNSGLTKDAVNNTITATANQLIYESPLIEVTPSREYFDVEVSPKLSGGIRLMIEGWDSDMNSISNTGNDVFFENATNETAGFGENSTTVTNAFAQRRIHIINNNAKYIKITVNASSAGVSFRRFTLEAITSYKFGKRQIEASAMIPNI